MDFICVRCKSNLIIDLRKDSIVCEKCGKKFAIIQGIPCLLEKNIEEYGNIEPFYREIWQTVELMKFDEFKEYPLIHNFIVSRKRFVSWHKVEYFKRIYHTNEILKNLVRYVENNFDKNAKLKILDLGCGLGNHLLKLLPLLPSSEFCGIDIVHEGLIKVNTIINGSNLCLVCANGRDLPVRNNYFDFVYSINAIEHIGRQMVDELARVLKKYGKCLIIAPSGESYKYSFWPWYLFCKLTGWKFKPHGPFVNEYLSWFRKNGLLVKKHYTDNYFRFLQEPVFGPIYDIVPKKWIKSMFEWHKKVGEANIGKGKIERNYMQYFELEKGPF